MTWKVQCYQASLYRLQHRAAADMLTRCIAACFVLLIVTNAARKGTCLSLHARLLHSMVLRSKPAALHSWRTPVVKWLSERQSCPFSSVLRISSRCRSSFTALAALRLMQASKLSSIAAAFWAEMPSGAPRNMDLHAQAYGEASACSLGTC